MDRGAHDVEQFRFQPGFDLDTRVQGSQALVFRADEVFTDEIIEVSYLQVETPRRARVSRSWTMAAAFLPDSRMTSIGLRRGLSPGQIHQQQVRVAHDSRKDVV